eukprot:6204544-Pleurochrysis_carterae.AAC.2
MHAGHEDSSSDDCAGLFAMPSAFSKPISAAEAKLLALSDGSDDRTDHDAPSDASFGGSSSLQGSQLPAPITASDPAAPTKSKRGRYKRENGAGIRNRWDTECELHMSQVLNGSLLAQEVCKKKCSFGNHCLQNCFTQSRLK